MPFLNGLNIDLSAVDAKPTREQAQAAEFDSRMEQSKTEIAKKAEHRKVKVHCFHCNNEYEIEVGLNTTLFDLENYCCPDCRRDYQITDDPSRVQGFDVYSEKYLRRLGWGI